MRLLIATPLYPPDIGGPATFAKTLVDELPKRGFKIAVVSFGDVRKFPKGISHLIYFFHLLKTGREADTILALDPVSVGVPSMVAAMLLRKRFFVRIAGDYAWEQGVSRFGVKDKLDVFSKRFDSYSFFVKLLKYVEWFVAKRAEKIIVPSEYLKGIVCNWGIDSKKIVVIYNSFEGPSYYGHKAVLRGMLKFRGKLIISVGRLVPWKGFKMLIEIMPKLLESLPDLKLLIVGDGPDREKLEKRVRALKLDEQVVFTGSLSQDVLLRYINTADVFVLNTNYEGFSHLLLEVMSVGVPVITTPVGGNPELITDGKEGIMVPYNSRTNLMVAIQKILKDKNLSRRLVNAGQRKAKTFSRERMIAVVIKVLK